MLDSCHIDYLIAVGATQDEVDFYGLTAVGVFGYALPLDVLDGGFVATAAPLTGSAAKLTCRSYKAICAFGFLDMFICNVCVKLPPFAGRFIFCPLGELY